MTWRMVRVEGTAWVLVGVCASVLIGMRVGAQSTALSRMSVVYQDIPSDTNPLAKMIAVDLTNATYSEAVNQIAKRAGIVISYSADLLPHSGSVTIKEHRISVGDALQLVLRNTGLVVQVTPTGHVALVAAHAKPQATRTVSGRVTDSTSGDGVPGVTVEIQGTTLSVLTGEGGGFTLRNVPVGEQVLTVKMFGYKPVIRNVDVREQGSPNVFVSLATRATLLSGVVTTATGEQSKLSVGSDITTINVDSVMKTAPIHSVTDLLENRVPGLTVVHTSGTPGDPSRLLLRGAASIYGSNNPIVVVDGVRVYDPENLGSVQNQIRPSTANIPNSVTSGLARPSPLDQIDPNTIATIEVLKGPSASALYGSDAANGVIVITTKKGQPGQTHWSVNMAQGVSYIPGNYPVFTYAFGHIPGQVGETLCAGGENIGAGKVHFVCVIDSVRTFQSLNDPRFSPLTSGPLSRASATVSGGASALTYSFTGSAQTTHGMTKLPSFAAEQYTGAVGSAPPSWMAHPDDYAGWSGSGQVQAALSPTASLTVSDMLSNTTQHRTSLGLSVVGDLIDVYVDTSSLANVPAYNDFFTQITQATLTSTTNATLNWRIRSWLPLMVTGGYNRSQENDKQYLPAGLPAAILPLGADTTGGYDLGLLQNATATLNANTTIPLSLWNGRTLQLALGTNFVSASTTAQDISTSQIPVGVNDPTTFPQTTATSVIQQTQSTATYGWFLEPQLQFHSRVFITPGIRLDGGTASGSGAGLTIFPKTNVSYIALDRTGSTEGSGWTRALSLLRLRGAFGIAGVQPAPGQSLRLFNAPSIETLNGGTSYTTATFLTSLGNTTLHPERSREMEVGFDAQFFQNRATLTATYYNKLRIDAIEPVSVAPSVEGTQTTYFNVGSIRNTGLEVTSSIRVVDRDAVTWNVNGSVSSNQNLVLSTPVSVGGSCSNAQAYGYTFGAPCVRAGYPLNAQFYHEVVGYADLNHDGLIESNEIFLSDSLVYAGNPDPRYTATFGTTVGLWHGRVALSANADYQDGLAVTNESQQAFYRSAANAPDATIFDQVTAAYTLVPPAADGKLQVVNTLRFDNISMNVTLPMAVARAFRAQQATLGLQGSNLGLWTNYNGKDPNINSRLAGVNAVDNGGLPQPRVWQLTVSLTQ